MVTCVEFRCQNNFVVHLLFTRVFTRGKFCVRRSRACRRGLLGEKTCVFIEPFEKLWVGTWLNQVQLCQPQLTPLDLLLCVSVPQAPSLTPVAGASSNCSQQVLCQVSGAWRTCSHMFHRKSSVSLVWWRKCRHNIVVCTSWK